jgi:hypothetical protein
VLTAYCQSWRESCVSDASLWAVHCQIAQDINTIAKYWELIADNLSKASWSWGCVVSVDSEGRDIFVVGAHRDDGKRFVVHADEKLTAYAGSNWKVKTYGI